MTVEVKVCGITSVADAEACVEAGVDDEDGAGAPRGLGRGNGRQQGRGNNAEERRPPVIAVLDSHDRERS